MGRLRTIQSIYEDFLKRREGLINALTDGMFLMNHWFPWVQLKLTSVVHMIADSEDFFKACDPNRDNLCLYGKHYTTLHMYMADSSNFETTCLA